MRKKERGKRGDEAIVLMKKLWTEEKDKLRGAVFSVKDTLLPRPYQKSGHQSGLVVEAKLPFDALGDSRTAGWFRR